MPQSVTCPRCSRESTGFFCECGADLRKAFGVEQRAAQDAPSTSAAPSTSRPMKTAYPNPDQSWAGAEEAGEGAKLVGGTIGVIVVVALIALLMSTTGWFFFSFKLAKWIVLGVIGLVGAIFRGGRDGDGR